MTGLNFGLREAFEVFVHDDRTPEQRTAEEKLERRQDRILMAKLAFAAVATLGAFTSAGYWFGAHHSHSTPVAPQMMVQHPRLQ